jgi:hypothetical protein
MPYQKIRKIDRKNNCQHKITDNMTADSNLRSIDFVFIDKKW